MLKEWLVKNNNQEISLKSFYNKTKEFADKVVINYNLDNDNYVGINLIEKDYDQKGKIMTLEKLASIIMEFKQDVDNKFENLKEYVDDRFYKLENRMNIIEQDIKELKKDMIIVKNEIKIIKNCPTIKKEVSLY